MASNAAMLKITRFLVVLLSNERIRWYRLMTIKPIDMPYPLANPKKSINTVLVVSKIKIETERTGSFF
jgi:hypothetical protein